MMNKCYNLVPALFVVHQYPGEMAEWSKAAPC